MARIFALSVLLIATFSGCARYHRATAAARQAVSGEPRPIHVVIDGTVKVEQAR